MDLIFQAIVMGLVQGLTEFLPISSSGHLILVPWILGWTDDFIASLGFSVVVHMGTLAAILIYFWRDWVRLIPAGLAAIRDRSFRGDPYRRVAWLLVVATIPAAIIGALLNDFIDQNVREPIVVAAMLVVGGGILLFAEWVGARSERMEELSFPGALGIGVAQALALIPGISRSGISISAGLFLGLRREEAARFSFLMAAPITAGAGIFELRKLASEGIPAGHDSLLVVGVISSFIAGIAAIHVLLRFLRTRPTHVFVAYRVALAVVVAGLVFIR